MSTPKYCPLCKRNVVPQGGGGMQFHGTNLLLTICTCGLWWPIWLILDISRSGQKRGCPICGNRSLLPPRLED